MSDNNHCVICGNPLPDGSFHTRKYCDSCKVEHERCRSRKRSAERRRMKKSGELNPLSSDDKQPRTLQKNDMAYCAKCVYRGRFSAGYLCNYLLLTGEHRGCKYGEGCTRREIGAAKGEVGIKQCERCGASYVGGPSSHYCSDCRSNVSRDNARKAAEKNRERKQ